MDGKIVYESGGDHGSSKSRRIRRDVLSFTLNNGFTKTNGQVEIDVS